MPEQSARERHLVTVGAPIRLDQLLAERWDELDRSTIRALVTEGAVLVNGEPALKAGVRIEPGDIVEVALPQLELSPPPELPIGMAMATLYEDEVLLIVDKPSGVPVRETRRTEGPTLSQVLGAQHPDIAHVGGADRAGVVTTVDANVSGLVLVGKDEETYRELRRMVKHAAVREEYTALVEGNLRGEHVIDAPIGNVKQTRGRLAVAREGRPARTIVRGQQHFKADGRDYTLVTCGPRLRGCTRFKCTCHGTAIPSLATISTGRDGNQSYRMPVLHLSTLACRTQDGEPSDPVAVPQELHSILVYLGAPNILKSLSARGRQLRPGALIHKDREGGTQDA